MDIISENNTIEFLAVNDSVRFTISSDGLSSGGSGTTIWGGIGGAISNQVDLQNALDSKQATLVSGASIKTINSTTILGSGNLILATAAQGALADSALQGVAWGIITGNIVDQTDLQAALDDKATSAQGALADTAMQPLDNVSDLTNDAGYITDSSTDTLTNKSGSNSQWDNDANYIDSAGAPIQSVDSDTGAVKVARSITISIETPTAADSIPLGALSESAVTISKVVAYTTGASTDLTFQLEERGAATGGATGTDILTSPLVADPDGASTTSFSNAGITANNNIHLTASAITGAPTWLNVTIYFTKD